eukprot:3644088-Prymnesium_polylepis.1
MPAASSGDMTGSPSFRQSTSTKSLPRPWYLEKATFMCTPTVREGGARVGRCSASARHAVATSIDLVENEFPSSRL